MSSQAQFSNQQSIQNTINNLAAAQAQAEQYAQVLSTQTSGTPTSAQAANLQQAVAFFQAMQTNGTFTTSSGTVINFAQFGPNGVFGSKTSTFIADLTKVLNDYGNTVKVPTPNGGSVTVMDASTGQPATLADMIANPTHTFSFSFNNGEQTMSIMNPNYSISWCSGNFYNTYASQLFNSNGSGTVTTDASGNTIPGGGLNFNVDSHSSACSSSDNVNVTASGQALLNYVEFSPNGTNASVGADGEALSQFLQQNM